MQLYFAPLACSMATRIALEEAGLRADYIEVCPITKRILPDDQDYLAVHPLGLVPALRTDDGALLTENVAVLEHVAELAEQIPADARGRAVFREWLGFIATELHKASFAPFFDRDADDAVRAYARRKAEHRLAYLEQRLGEREFLVGERFSALDAYLVTVLNWVQATPIELKRYPRVLAYLNRHRERPSVAAALARELPLYLAERQRAQAL